MLKRQKGQGLVEFALLMPVLLLIILAIIEMALIFQGYLAVQHAAREAARWAVIYQPPKDLGESDQEYFDRRVNLIKWTAVEKATGLRIDEDHLGIEWAEWQAYYTLPRFFGIEVWGFPSFVEPPGGWTDDDLRDHPGLPGLPVRVRVTHNVELLDPIFRAIVPQVRVIAQTEMINEGTQTGWSNVAPPALPPPPPPQPIATEPPGPDDTPGTGEPTFTVPATPTNTPTAIPTSTATRTPTPTTTPEGPFITSSQYIVEPNGLILIDVNQHPAIPGEYQLWWRNVDDYNDVVIIDPSILVDGSGFLLGYVYTVPPETETGQYYLETHWPSNPPPVGAIVAQSWPIIVQPTPPDLVVSAIILDQDPMPNTEITVTVDILNQSNTPAMGYFDVDLYVDSELQPLPQHPGTSKVWIDGLGAFESMSINHVVILYGGGPHELWARVDTSEWIEEGDENNNLFGPIGVTAVTGECSDLVDRFSGDVLDPKWSAEMIGNASTFNQTLEDDGTLTLVSDGTSLWNNSDAGFSYLYQPVSGDFIATLKINAGPTNAEYSKMGLMVRGSTGANSAHVMVVKTGSHGVQFAYRCGNGDSTTNFASNTEDNNTPVWVRLVRTDDIFIAYYSYNGINWIKSSGSGDGMVGDSELDENALIGIAIASYDSSPGTGNVDDFEVCSGNDPGADNCTTYSDDFDDNNKTGWLDLDIGATLPGSSEETNQTITVYGDGASLWGSSDNFHYTYKEVEGDFVADLKINQVPNTAQWAKGGLMVRSNLQPDSALVMAMRTNNNNYLQFAAREADGDGMARIASDVSDGLPTWVRIIRSGNAFSILYSDDGISWSIPSGYDNGAAEVDMGDTIYIGLAVSAYDGAQLADGEFDDFVFCSSRGSGDLPPPPPPEEKPPGLRECVQVIELGDFEASVITPPWERNADAVKDPGRAHSGNYSLRFPASKRTVFPFDVLEPWSYQPVPVPGDVIPETEATLSFWYFTEPMETPDADDHFYLGVRNSAGNPDVMDIPLAQGNEPTFSFQQQVISVEQHIDITAYSGENMQLYFYGAHDADDDGSWFYLDDVEFDICTTQPVPDDEPGTASLGGQIEVIIGGTPARLPGVSVWASAPPNSNFQTQSIHDGTYHFYNIPPGTYVIYAEVWSGGNLHTGTTEVTLVADERNYNIDLLLFQ